MNRKTFLWNLAAAGTILPCCSNLGHAEAGKCDDAKCVSDASAVPRGSRFLPRATAMILRSR